MTFTSPSSRVLGLSYKVWYNWILTYKDYFKKINELSLRKEMEILFLTIKQHNCAKAAKESLFSASSLSVFITWKEFVYRNGSINLFPHEIIWWSVYCKGFFSMYAWGEMELDDFLCVVWYSVPRGREKVCANYQNPHSVLLFFA